MTVRSHRNAPTGIRFVPYGKEALRERRGIEQIQNHSNMDYSNLIRKTILDLTNDKELISSVLANIYPNGSYEEYVTFIKRCKGKQDDWQRYQEQLMLAQLTKNKELEEQVEKQFDGMFENLEL